MVITTPEQYNSILKRISSELCVITPVYRDIRYHVAENEVLCTGITFNNNEHFVISNKHKDAPQFLNREITYTDDLIQILAYQTHRNAPRIQNSFTPYIRDTHNLFGVRTNVNDVIPLSVWADVLRDYNNNAIELLSYYPNQYMVELVNTLRKIELAGMCVNKELLAQFFEEKTLQSFRGNFVYSQYNPFTTTGRPSNRYGNINFSALNKTDGTREMFISRFPNGSLLQFDFEAYHLRLIADYLDITLPSGSIHTELAKIYFNTNVITPTLYEESKKITFNILYGNTDYTIPLFEKVLDFKNSFTNQTKLLLPSNIEVEVAEPSASKLFNYYIQSLEMYKTLPKLQQVLDYLQNKNAFLTLYTYDSILIDVENIDVSFITDVKYLLQGNNNKFPVRTYVGKTYNSLALM